jgi:Protein of unknown function (DUF4232)
MTMKAIAAVALACAAVVVGAAAGDATSTAHASAAPHRCYTNYLRASLLGRPPGAGQRYAHVQLTNISKHTCTIYGYAGAQLLGPHGGHIPTDIVRDHSRTPHLITLRPGRRASASWHWGAVPGPGEQGRKQCEPTASTIEITPPDATTQRRIHWPFGPVCEHGRIIERPFSGPY